MKKMKILRFLILLSVLMFPGYIYAQCDSDAFLDKCASRLETFTFVKAFNTSLKKAEKTEYSYVFSKGSNYMIIVGDLDIAGERMIINLYDRNHKLIASSFNAKTKSYYPDLVYPCSATGVYYMEVTFEGAKGGCGVCILGFKKSE
jgi:hypothetical protein